MRLATYTTFAALIVVASASQVVKLGVQFRATDPTYSTHGCAMTIGAGPAHEHRLLDQLLAYEPNQPTSVITCIYANDVRCSYTYIHGTPQQGNPAVCKPYHLSKEFPIPTVSVSGVPHPTRRPRRRL